MRQGSPDGRMRHRTADAAYDRVCGQYTPFDPLAPVRSPAHALPATARGAEASAFSGARTRLWHQGASRFPKLWAGPTDPTRVGRLEDGGWGMGERTSRQEESSAHDAAFKHRWAACRDCRWIVTTGRNTMIIHGWSAWRLMRVRDSRTKGGQARGGWGMGEKIGGGRSQLA